MKMPIGDAMLNIAEHGNGPDALVFLHYFGGSGRAWAHVAALLAERWRCVMPDLRGFGDSNGMSGPFSLNRAADDVLNLVRHLKLERWQLIGHSMGGKIALAVAARQPPGLSRLILLAPSPPTPEPIAASKRANLLASQTSRTAAEKAAHESCGQLLPDALFQQVVDDRLRTAPAAWRWWLESGSREHLEAAMPQVVVPVQVLSGELDTDIPAAVIKREVMARLPLAKLSLITGCGHLLPLEAPLQVAQAIRG